MVSQRTLFYRSDIQGLRAIAIILVILAHGEISFFRGGFVGVDVFFVLSGYLITGLLLSEYESSGNIRLATFYARRLKRLLPALAVMLCVATLVAPVLLSPHEVTEQTTSLAYAATWTSNLYFAFSNLDYFAELRARDLFLHTWSLGLEEQFYLIWPLLLLISLGKSARASAGSTYRALMAVLALLFVASLSLSWFLTYTQTTWAYYLMPSRIWQFALGASVFCALQNRSPTAGTPAFTKLTEGWHGQLRAIGAVLILASATLIDKDMPYPGFLALFPSFGAAMILAAGDSGGSSGVDRIMASRVFVWIGNHAYSWYLWHWPVFTLGFALGVQTRVGGTAILIALSLACAILSYRWIELPFWKGRFSNIPIARAFSLSGLAMLTVIAISTNYLRSLAPAEKPTEIPAYNASLDRPDIYTRGCDSYYRNSDVQPCISGDQNAPKTVVLIGDSIGVQWTSMLSGRYQTPEWRTIVLTKSSCPMVDEEVFDRRGQLFTFCMEWRNKVFDYLDSIRPDVVILGSAATYGFPKTQWIEGSARVLKRVTKATRRVVVIPGTPKLSFDGPGCLERQVGQVTGLSAAVFSSCRETLANSQAADVADYLAESVRQFQNARLLNLNDLVCPGNVCAAKLAQGHIVFRDSQHLTDSFVRFLTPKVAKRYAALNW